MYKFIQRFGPGMIVSRQIKLIQCHPQKKRVAALRWDPQFEYRSVSTDSEKGYENHNSQHNIK